MSLSEVAKRSVRAAVDMHNYWEATRELNEEFDAFVVRRTREFITNLSKNAEWKD
jgi:hypothetical protein